MIQTIKDAMRQNNTDWHISSTSLMQQHQEHLILLFHARKCPHDEDTVCPVTPQCAEAKRMWKHIAECKDKKCGEFILFLYRWIDWVLSLLRVFWKRISDTHNKGAVISKRVDSTGFHLRYGVVVSCA